MLFCVFSCCERLVFKREDHFENSFADFPFILLTIFQKSIENCWDELRSELLHDENWNGALDVIQTSEKHSGGSIWQASQRHISEISPGSHNSFSFWVIRMDD